MAVSSQELEIIIKSLAEGQGLDQINEQLEEFNQKAKETTTASNEAGASQDSFGSQANELANALGIATAKVDILRNTLGFVKDFLSQSAEAARESALSTAELTTAYTANAGAAGLSQQELEALATSLQKSTLFSDEAVQHGESVLLTYDKIGSQTFPRATQAITDLAQMMGGDLQGAAQTLGRSLQVPEEAASRLARQGIILSQAQQDQIDSFMRVNDIASAQGLILDAVEARYGGQAEAARQAAGSAVDLSVAYGDLQEQFGALLVKLQDAGAADAGVSFLDRLTQGAGAWQGVIDNLNLLSAAYQEVGQTEQEAAAAGAAATAYLNDQKAALDNTAGGIQNLIEWWIGATAGTEEMASAVQEASGVLADTSAPYMYARSVEQITKAAEDAAAAQDDLARATLSAQAAAAAGAYGSSDDFTSQRTIAGYQAGTAAGKEARDQQARDAEASAREQERTTEQTAKNAAKAMETSFKSAADNIASAIEAAIKPTLQEVWQPPAGAQDHVDEAARQLATVATEGFGSDFLTKLGQQFTGQSFWKPIAAAAASGDEGALKEAASQTLIQFQQGLIPQLYNIEMIKNQVRAQLQQQRIKEQLIETVKKELGVEGVTASVGMINVAAGDAKAATDTVTTDVADMATAAKTAGADMAGSTSEYEKGMDRVIIKLRTAIGLTDTWNSKTREAGAALDTVGAGASNNGVPNQAQQKMGPTRGL